MSDAYIGEIRIFACAFAPEGWALCNGQLLAIGNHTQLFSVLGATYGGNGMSTFAVPDMRDRVPIGAGHGPGLPKRSLGDVGEFVGTAPSGRTPPSDISLLGVLPNVVVNFCIAIYGIYPTPV